MLSGCKSGGGSNSDAGGCSASDAGISVDCSTGACTDLTVRGDPTGAGYFGYGNPKVFHDPGSANRSWLVYSSPVAQPIPNPDGGSTLLLQYTVNTHLAVSNDNGASWALQTNLWPAVLRTDPTSGHQSYLNSEVAGLAAVSHGNTITWYGVHMRYLLKPEADYNPDFTSITLRVATADGATPEVLANAPETILGYSFTAPYWNPNLRLNSLSPELTNCFWNNPTIHFLNGKLYLIPECVISTSTGGRDAAHSKISMFSTVPTGAPSSWTWAYAGSIADSSTAAQLGTALVQQLDLAPGRDGRLLAIFSPTEVTSTGIDNHGCVIASLTSLDPPVYEKDCTGNLRVLGRVSMPLGGACTYDPASTVGVIVNKTLGGGYYSLLNSGLRP